MRDLAYVAGAAVVVGLIGWIISKTPHVGAGAPAGTPAPGVASPKEGRGHLLGAAPVTVFPGMTYFVTLEANGSVALAANAARVKARAESEGFRDVVVERARPSNWPGTIDGDYFARGTFKGDAPKVFPRHVDVFAGSANLLDAWEA